MEKLRPTSGILDLAIVGGGPAGTAAALEAGRHGLRVAIWERDRFPRDKVCGEFISFEALPLLQAEIPATAARGTVIHSAEFVPDNGVARFFRLPRPALGLSRCLLDAALWNAVLAAGIEAHDGTSIRKVRKLIPASKQRPAWELDPATGNIRRARALIVASGRWWKIEGLSSPARPGGSSNPGDWIGAKAHFAGIQPRDRVEMYFFRGGYCGLAPVEDGLYNVCLLVHRGNVRGHGAKEIANFAAWLERISHHPALTRRLRGAMQVSPVVTTAPVHLARRQATQGGALMVGDASGFLDPFTGAGISMALHSGRLAAQALAKSLPEEFDVEGAAGIYEQNLVQAVRRSYKVAAIARALIHGPAWVQGLVTAPLPWMGKRLVRETRWRENRKAYLD